MRIPTIEDTEALLNEAGAANPGPWVAHSRNVARAARNIAAAHGSLDPDAAYILGFLHDIGRRQGVTGVRHTVDGYSFLHDLGFDDAARICLTHSFSVKIVGAIYGEQDCSPEELRFLEGYLDSAEYDDYDRLIQLCDALADANGFVLIEKRMLDVTVRYGVNRYTVAKWRATLAIRDDFEAAMGCSMYSLLPGVAENTFGLALPA
jgi:hypothetical protein